ncbi:amidohydrolase [Hyalangium minutum]|uniref:Exoenzymes regulatory protein AepA n=1 Tax=Hyalangium minutum TaxID=394096 RepID=A0A085WPH6_9BACT|nr:amidohydrolase [Hyalangium minutum]KFE69589.1 Exoenzymes regulatory protein AepA precursor [Hyalangium minutum]
MLKNHKPLRGMVSGLICLGVMACAAREVRPAAGETAELIITNGKVTTLDAAHPEVSALAVKEGRILAVGDDAQIKALAGPSTRRVDAGGRRVIPGLNDSHNHVIRGGLNYTLELRWDGVRSLKRALEMLREQAARTPKGQWVRVVGGWTEFQFEERRMPTLEEINAATGDTPAFILNLYNQAFVNQAAVAALGWDAKTPNPPGGEIQRGADGRPTGLLLAKPDALILYSTLARAPKLTREEQLNSTRHFLREYNRFGLTSAIDAGGGGQNFPDDYSVIEEVADKGELTLRISYYLFAQKRGQELADYQRWVGMTKPGTAKGLLRPNGYLMAGGGENLVWAAADFENFLEERPELKPGMEAELKPIISLLVKNRWPFRIHGTYDESIRRFLDVFEAVNRETPFDGLRWAIDHGETLTPETLARVKALGGGVAIQSRMTMQGEYFVRRYGAKAAEEAPPVRKMLELGVPVGAGTDATRVDTYNPWVALSWMTTGRTEGGLVLTPPEKRLSRQQALELYTVGSAWFSGEEKEKGRLAPGQLADFAILSEDYLSVPEERIRGIESVLTVVDGKPVYGAGEYAALSPALPLVLPEWSPVTRFGGYASGTQRAP